MATADTPLEFNPEQKQGISQLARFMSLLAGILMLLGAMNLLGGLLTLLLGSPIGLLAVVEGAVTLLLGLIMLSSSADVHYMIETKYTPIHLGNAFNNLTVFYKTQFFLALFLIAVWTVRLFAG